jgi:hypothetical protein
MAALMMSDGLPYSTSGANTSASEENAAQKEELTEQA